MPALRQREHGVLRGVGDERADDPDVLGEGRQRGPGHADTVPRTADSNARRTGTAVGGAPPANARADGVPLGYAVLVDIKIGIINSPREIAFETAQSAEEIEQAVAAALESQSTHLSLKDEKGRRFIVPVASLAYVEVGAEESRRIGFVA